MIARITLLLICLLISSVSHAVCTVKDMATLLNDFSSCASRGLPEGCITPQNLQDLICSIPTIAGPATTSADGTYTCPTVTVTNGIPDFVTASCVLQNITGITLSNTAIIGGQPSGTTVGTITVGMSPASPSFAGGLGLSGTGASSFQIVSGALKTNGVVTSGNYDINIIATQPTGVSNSPFTQSTTIAVQDISSVALSNNQIVGGQPSGTLVGQISVGMTPTSPGFSGSLSLTGAASTSFRISGSSLLTNAIVANGTYNLNIVASQGGGSRTQAVTITASAQTIASVILSNDQFISGTGSANTTVGNVYVVMSPATPAFSGTLSLTGTSAGSFALSGSQFKVGGSNLSAANYSLNIVATQAGATGSPKTQAQTIVGAPVIWVNDQTRQMPHVCLRTIWINPSPSTSGPTGGGKRADNGGLGTQAAPYLLASDLTGTTLTPGSCINLLNTAPLYDSWTTNTASVSGTFTNAPDGHIVIRSTDNTGARVPAVSTGGVINSAAATWTSNDPSHQSGQIRIVAPSDYWWIDGINFWMRGQDRSLYGLECIHVGDNNGNNIFKGSTHFRATNNNIHGCGAGAIAAAGSDYVVVQDNVCQSVTISQTVFQESCFAIAGSGSAPGYVPNGYDDQLCTNMNGSCQNYHTVVTGNILADAYEAAVNNSSDGNGIIIDTNVMAASETNAGAYLYRTLVANNLSYNIGGKGIYAFQSQHIDFVGNTIIKSDFDPHNIGTTRGAAMCFQTLDCVMANNLAYAIGPNTTVKTTGTGTSLAVNDVGGFLTTQTFPIPTAPSPSNPLNVFVDGIVNTIVGVSIDPVNTSPTPGGLSGVVTLGTAVASPHGNSGVLMSVNFVNGVVATNSTIATNVATQDAEGASRTTCVNWSQPVPCTNTYVVTFNGSSNFWYSNLSFLINSPFSSTPAGDFFCGACAVPPSQTIAPGNNILAIDPLLTQPFFVVSPDFELNGVSVNATGSGCVAGERLTLSGGSPDTAAIIQIDAVSSGHIILQHTFDGGAYPSNTTTNFTVGSTTGSCAGATFNGGTYIRPRVSTTRPNPVLQVGSPAIATGNTNYVPSRNFLGAARTSPPNIGAY